MKFLITSFLCFVFTGYTQTEIKLQKNPHSEYDYHKIVMLKTDYDRQTKKFYDIKSKTTKYAWKELKIDVIDFKSLSVKKSGRNYNIIIQLDADGILKLDLNTTGYEGETLAFVFKDTIYQTKKIQEPILNGQFEIKNITKLQKDDIVTTLTSLPPYAIQKQLYSAIQSHKTEKIDSLLAQGAQLVDGGYKVGYNNFKDVIYDLFRSKNSKYKKYQKTIQHLLKRGFVPNPKNLKQAIVFEDIEYIKKHFTSEKNTEKRKLLLRKKLKDIINNGSLEILKLVEQLGLKLEPITFGRHNILMEAVLHGDNDMIRYLLTKKIPYEPASLLAYTAIYREINTVDVLLQHDIDINSLFKEDNSTVGHVLFDLEFKHEYFMDNVALKRVHELMERGLDVKKVNKSNETVLHALAPYVKKYLGFGRGAYATYSPTKVAEEVIAFVKLAKAKGVDTTLKDNKGLTAYDYVVKDAKAFKIEDKALIKEVLTVFK